VSAFVSGMRGAFLYLSRQRTLRRYMETSGQAQRLTSRFVAGLELEDGLEVAGQLRSRGIYSSLDHLGENVSTEAEAASGRDAYLGALDAIAAAGLPSTVSVKVTSLGLDISPELCMANTEAIVRKAAMTGSLVECDMEDSSYTDRTLDIVHEMQRRYPGRVRAVIQAYLYRSEGDIDDLNARQIPVRLCKGAYREPAAVAWQEKHEVDASYVKLMKKLLDHGEYPAIASHDDAILREALAHVSSRRIDPDAFEFQMLYGVRRKLQRQVVAKGFRLRLYVPYGQAWYPYFMRRLAERPANVLFVARSLVGD